MPGLSVFILEDSLQKNPELNHLLQHTPAGPGKARVDLSNIYSVRLNNDPLDIQMNIIQACALYGKKDQIKSLSRAGYNIVKAVEASRYYAFGLAARNGHTETIQCLGSYLYDFQIKEAVKSCNYYATKMAASNDNMQTIQCLESYLSDEEKKEAAEAAIRWAALNGHLQMIQYLESHLSDEEKKEAVQAVDYQAFRWAARNDHLQTIQYLESHLSDEEKKEAVQADDYQAIKWTARNGHTQTFNHLMNYPFGFAHAELKDFDRSELFGRVIVPDYVYPFVLQKLKAYQEAKTQFEQAIPNRVFNLDEKDAELCFYLLRNLIRRGGSRDDKPAERLTDGIHFLLSIPSVRALCHRQMSEYGGANELLRLAVQIGNQDAIGLLLQLPDVRRLAEQNNLLEGLIEENNSSPFSLHAEGFFSRKRQLSPQEENPDALELRTDECPQKKPAL